MSGSVIRRAPRSNVTYDHAHWIMTSETVAKADQEEDVDEQPEQPGEEAGRLDRPDLGDGGAPADRGQHPLVDVTERQPRLAAQGAHDVLRGVPPLLHGGGGDARHESSVVFEVGQVADDVDIVTARDGQLGLDHDAAGPVERDAERLGQRRGGDPRGPDDRLRMDPLAADPDSVGVDPRDLRPRSRPSRRAFRAAAGPRPTGLRCKRPRLAGWLRPGSRGPRPC